MLQSLIVYTYSALILYVLGVMAANANSSQYMKSNDTPFWSLGVVLSILFFAFLAGARYNVGIDHLSYLSEYEYLLKNGHMSRETFELGFGFIAEIFAFFKLHYFFFFAFWGALQLFFIYYAVKKEPFLLPFLGVIIILGPWFLDWMNGIRQCVVECIFVFSITFIQRRKFLKFLILILLSSLIHKSALILLPFYFLPNKHFNYSKYVYILILLLCVVLGNNPYWVTLFQKLKWLLLSLGYDNYAEDIKDLTTDGLRDIAFGPNRISILLINVFIIYYYSKMRAFFKNTSPNLTLYFNLFFIGVCAYNLFVNTSSIFLRPIEYFIIFTLLLNGYLLYYLYKTKKIAMFIIVLLLSCSYTYINVYKSYLNLAIKVDYHFFFEN